MAVSLVNIWSILVCILTSLKSKAHILYQNVAYMITCHIHLILWSVLN